MGNGEERDWGWSLNRRDFRNCRGTTLMPLSGSSPRVFT